MLCHTDNAGLRDVAMCEHIMLSCSSQQHCMVLAAVHGLPLQPVHQAVRGGPLASCLQPYHADERALVHAAEATTIPRTCHALWSGCCSCII